MVGCNRRKSSAKMLTPVILCGGSGTRLWPLSRKSFPKQFVPLIGEKSLLQLTCERVAGMGDEVICVAAEEHRFMVAETLVATKVSGPVLLEPVARNTAAAMALAALQVKTAGKPTELLLFCPADHYIPDAAAFVKTVASGRAAAEAGAIVTFGVAPSFPSTAYGYIRQGAPCQDGSRVVAQFIEKPDAATAQSLLLGGCVLWNAGIFLTRADRLLAALKTHAPDILDNVQAAFASRSQECLKNGLSGGQVSFVRPAIDSFTATRSQSIDYAVIEPLATQGNVAVVPFFGQWSDVGSWNAVADLTLADTSGNRIHGQGFAHDARNTFIHAPHRPVVALGTQDLLIIDTPDALLVASRDHAESVKHVVARLERENCNQALMHRKVARPWGDYDCIDEGHRFKVKRITVKAGACISLQKHHHRAEHWIVVKGTAEVTCGERTFFLSENQSTYIPIGETHRLSNPGKLDVEIIEVQSGSYLGEDDIIRLEDHYGR